MKGIFILLLICSNSFAQACSYVKSDTTLEDEIATFKKKQNGIIFEGKVLSMEYDTSVINHRTNNYTAYYLIKPQRCWSKMSDKTKTVRIHYLDPGRCGFRLELDSTYLLYAENIDSENVNPTYVAYLYHPNKLIKSALEDIQLLGEPILTLDSDVDQLKSRPVNYVVLLLLLSMMLNLILIIKTKM